MEQFFSRYAGEYDIVHIHIPNAAFIVLSCAKKYGVPVRIVHSHNSRGADGFIKKIRNFLLNRWGIHFANRYMACSLKAGEYLFGRKMCMQEQFTILNNAIFLDKYKFDLEKRKEIRGSLGIGEEILLGHVGRFVEQKNHMLLLDIFSKLWEKGWKGKLLLLGEGELKNEVEKKAESLHIKERVILVGAVPNVNEYMSAMDVFLLPSLYEGLPVVCVEAQAAGLPCIISSEVSREIKVSDLVQFLNVNEVEVWCDCIRKIEIDIQKRSCVNRSRLENFDIVKQGKYLEELYFLFCRDAAQGVERKDRK